MLSLHTNVASLSIQNKLASTQNNLSTSMTRLGTGMRINSAKDDAAGLQIATRLQAQTRGMEVAIKNTQNATAMLQTADGALDEVGNILLRMKDLSTQAADDSSSADDRTAMQSEYDALGEELKNIMSNTSYGGTKLLKGGALSNELTFQIGASSAETMKFNVSTKLTALDTALEDVSNAYKTGEDGAEDTELLTRSTANTMIGTLDGVINKVGELRSSIGAEQNRLEHTNSNLLNMSTNTADATGRIMDTDYARESSVMANGQTLMQANTMMLKQATSMSQLVLSLIQ